MEMSIFTAHQTRIFIISSSNSSKQDLEPKPTSEKRDDYQQESQDTKETFPSHERVIP